MESQRCLAGRRALASTPFRESQRRILSLICSATPADVSNVLPGTELEFSADGVLIGGSRRCVVDGEFKQKVATGDQFIELKTAQSSIWTVTGRVRRALGGLFVIFRTRLMGWP